MTKTILFKRTLAVLCAAVLMLGAIPTTVYAVLGGDFPWTAPEEQTLMEQILERDGFLDGIWYPWFDGGRVGHSLTGNETMVKYEGTGWSTVAMDTVGADEIYQQIYNLKAMGYNLLGYGGSIYDEGVIFDDYGDVLGIKQEFLDNARRLLDMCREIGMPVMWTVCFHSSSAPGYYGIEAYDIFSQKYCNPEITEHYVERFVRPMCEMLGEYKDVVALIAIADEPENEINDSEKGNHFSSREMYGVNRDDMVHFMSRINDVVKEELPDVARTVASNDSDKSIYGGFDLDLMGHNVYHNGCSTPDVEGYKTDTPIILTEYNVGHDLQPDPNDPDYDLFTDRLKEWRTNMMDKGYRGGVQWAWMNNGTHSRTAYYLLDTPNSGSTPNTDFVPTVGDLRHFIDDYRATYRGETIVLDTPVLYCNEGGGIVEWIPSRQDVTVTIRRSTDGGATWTTVESGKNQSEYMVTYTDFDGEVHDKNKCRFEDEVVPNSMYKIIVKDAKGNVAQSEPNNQAGVELKYKKTTTYTTVGGPIGIGKHWNAASTYRLYSFGEVNNRPATSDKNLLKNAGFESATGVLWNTGNFMDSATVITDATAPEGDKCLYFDATGDASGKWYRFEVPVAPYTDYVFSTWVKGDFLSETNAGNASIGVIAPDTGKFMYYSANKASRDNNQIYPTAWDGDWHLRSVAFNSQDMTSVTIALYGVGSHLYVDDMALFKNGHGLKYVGTNMASTVSMDFNVPNTYCSDQKNLVGDGSASKTDFWQTGYGWRNGFMSINESTVDYGNSLKYTASDDPYGLYFIKWIPVEQNTRYVFSFDMKILEGGKGKLVLLDDRMTGPQQALAFECDIDNYGGDWASYSIVVNPRGFTRLGIAVCDLGGAALYDNIRLFKVGDGTDAQDLYVSDLKKTVKADYNETAKVTVNAKGDGLTYKWYFKDKGASRFSLTTSYTGKTYSVKMTESRNGCQVYCVVTDKYGAKRQTNPATLSITPVTITTQPKTTYTKMGATAKVTVKASGNGLTYTWYVKGAGKTAYTKSSVKTATYSVTMSSATKGRMVYCVVKDKWGNKVTTNKASLREAVSITAQPKTTYTKMGVTAKVAVKASGDDLTYTWYYKNAGKSSYSKSSVKTATYSVKMSSASKNRVVYCVVKDKWGKTVQTNKVRLREAASITTQPKTTYTKVGATAKVSVKASGDDLTYTWYYKNAGKTSYSKSSVKTATYSVKMSSASKNRMVYCVVKDKYGNTVKTVTVTLKMK